MEGDDGEGQKQRERQEGEGAEEDFGQTDHGGSELITEETEGLQSVEI